MVNNQISDLGTRDIAISGLGEIYQSALGNGVCKPGEAVGIIAATGKVVGTDLGAGTTNETFIGILDNDYSTADNTAIPDGSPCHVIVPQSGHLYQVWTEDPGDANSIEGFPMGFSNTLGLFEDIATMGTAGVYANLYKAQANGDDVAIIRWR
jgi:hypothetical protein